MKVKGDAMGSCRHAHTGVRIKLGPWAWIPVILLLSWGWRVADTIRFYPTYMIIPLAAMLGRRYHQQGLLVVALGGLLLPIGLSFSIGFSGPHLDVYLIALLVCIVAGSERPLLEWVPDIRPSVGFFAAFLLLPLAIGLYGVRISHGIEIRVVFDFQLLFYVFLFVVGLSRFRLDFLVATLAGAAVAGILLESVGLPTNARALFGAPRAELPVYGLTELRYLWVAYGLDSPAEFFTGLAYFWSGRLFASMLQGRNLEGLPWRRSYGLVILMVVLALGSELNTYAFMRLSGLKLASHFRLLGSSFALPIAALLASLLLRYRGVLLVLTVVMIFWGLDGLIRSGFDFHRPRLLFPLHEPLSVLAFGALGLRMRDLALGTQTAWWSKRWAIYILLLLIILPTLIEPKHSADLLLLIVIFVGAIVTAVALNRMRQKVLGREEGDHGGWLSLVALILVGLVVWSHLQTATSLLRTLWDLGVQIKEVIFGKDDWLPTDNRLILPVFVILLVWLTLSALLGFVKHLPRLTHEAARLIGLMAKKQGLPLRYFKGLAGSPTEPRGAVPSRLSGPWKRLLRILSLLRRATGVVAIALPLFVLLYQAYPREGIWPVIRNWLTPDSRRQSEGRHHVEAKQEPRVNPFLWQAALDYISEMRIEEIDPLGYLGLIRTDWYKAPERPQIRTRLSFYIGRDLDLNSVKVYLRRQERGLFGVWVERDRDFFEERKELDEIRQAVFERAQALARREEAK